MTMYFCMDCIGQQQILWTANGANKLQIPDFQMQYLHCNPTANFGQIIANKTENFMEGEQNRKFYPNLLQVKHCTGTTFHT